MKSTVYSSQLLSRTVVCIWCSRTERVLTSLQQSAAQAIDLLKVWRTWNAWERMQRGETTNLHGQMKSSMQLAMLAARIVCLPFCYPQLQTIILCLVLWGLKLDPPHSGKNTGWGAWKWAAEREIKRSREEVTGEWRKLHNVELHDVYCWPDIIVRVMKSMGMRWTGHMESMAREKKRNGFGWKVKEWDNLENLDVDCGKYWTGSWKTGYEYVEWIHLSFFNYLPECCNLSEDIQQSFWQSLLTARTKYIQWYISYLIANTNDWVWRGL